VGVGGRCAARGSMKCRHVGALLLDAGIGCAARICGAAARHMIEARLDWPQTITLGIDQA
jgi:hypothetical protein